MNAFARNPRRQPPTCKYSVDAQDRIVSISGEWDDFARENHGEPLSEPALLKQNLWKFIAGLENRLVYRQIMDYVRARRRAVRFLFRCDGPNHRRLAGMRVSPEPEGGCSFETLILRERPRPYLPLLDTRCPKSSDTIALCNWCMRADCGPLGWRDLFDPTVRATLHALSGTPRPFFTICPVCLAIRRALQ
jgi:hypothetical protein